MLNEIAVLLDVTSRLEALGLPYMLTGSLALGYYAQPRMTRDIDIVVALGESDVPRVVAAFSDDYYVPEGLARLAVAKRTVFNLIHTTSIVKVDIVVRKDTPYRRHEFARRTAVRIDGGSVFIVSREDLVLSKLDWARSSRSEMQLSDVRSLLSAGCDVDYLRQWAEVLGVGALLEEVLA